MTKQWPRYLKWQKSSGFGLVAKMDISIPRGNGATPQVIKTLKLNKTQCIMVAAKLNDSLLIKVVKQTN